MKQMRSLGLLLQHTFKVLGKKFPIIALPLLLYGALSAVVTITTNSSALINNLTYMSATMMGDYSGLISEATSTLQMLVPFFIASLVLSICVYPLVLGIIYTVQFSEIEGINRNLGSAVRIAVKNWGRMIITSLATNLTMLGIGVGVAFVGSLLATFLGALGIVVVLAMMFALIVISIAINYAFAATMATRVQGFSAVKQGIDIMLKGGFGRNLGYAIVTALIFAGASLVLSSILTPFVPISMSDPGAQTAAVIITIISTLITQVMSSFTVVSSGFLYINAQTGYDAKNAEYSPNT